MFVPLRKTLFLILLCSSQAFSVSHILRRWVIDIGTSVRQDSLDHFMRTNSNNLIGNAGAQDTCKLYGCRNMFSPFNLVISADGTGITSCNVTIDSLNSGSNIIKNTNANTDPFDWTGKPIEMFVAHYTNVNGRSHWSDGGFGYGWTNATPGYNSTDSLYFKGKLPNLLVPFSAPSGAKTNGQGGAPFAIAANKSQTVAIDIYVPRTQATGIYTGKIRIFESGIATDSIPIKLKVYNTRISDTTHAVSWVEGSDEAITNRFGRPLRDATWYAIQDRFYRTFHRHRVAYTDGRVDTTGFKANIGKFYTGTGYTSADKYDGPGVSIGDNVYSIGAYDMSHYASNGFCKIVNISSFTYSQSAVENASNAWEQWFETNANATLRFKYLIDEPDEGDFDNDQNCVLQVANWIHNNAGVGHLLKVFDNPAIHFDWFDTLDIASFSSPIDAGRGYNINNAETQGLAVNDFKARPGKSIGIYNGVRPFYGNSNLLDCPPTDARINIWIMPRYTVGHYFLWQSSFYGTDGGNSNNIWGDDYYKTDGNLVATGRDTLFTGDGRGVAGPIVDVNLKNWRCGVEDYELMWLCDQNGISYSSILTGAIPRALNDYNAGDGYTTGNQQPVWYQKGYQFEVARKALLDLLAPDQVSATATPFRALFRVK